MTLAIPAYLDSLHGLIPCTVTGWNGVKLVVDFPDEDPLHWSGLTTNAWRGRSGEEFAPRYIVPVWKVHKTTGVSRGAGISPYNWGKIIAFRKANPLKTIPREL